MLGLNRNLSLLFITNMAAFLCRGMIESLLPLIIHDLGAAATEIGLVLFAGGMVGTLLYIPSGLASDRYPRRTILALGCLMMGSSALYLTSVSNWKQALLGSILFSSSLSIFIPARMALVADNARSENLAIVYGIMNMTFPIGFTIGPATGGFLAENYGWDLVLCVSASMAFLSIVPTFLIKKTHTYAQKRGEKESEKRDRTFFLRREILLMLFLISLFHIFGNTARGILSPTVPLYLTYTLDVSKTKVGLFLSAGLGVSTFIAQIPAGILADKYGNKRMMIYCTCWIPLFALIWPLLNNYLQLVVLYILITGFWSMTWPAAAAYLMNLSPTSKRGSAMSIRQTANSVGLTVGPIIGGFLWDTYSPQAPFYASALFFVLAFFLVFSFK